MLILDEHVESYTLTSGHGTWYAGEKLSPKRSHKSLNNCMMTKLCDMVTELERLLPIKLYDPLFTWSHEIT